MGHVSRTPAAKLARREQNMGHVSRTPAAELARREQTMGHVSQTPAAKLGAACLTAAESTVTTSQMPLSCCGGAMQRPTRCG
jgi:hypothetical protein